MDAFLQEQFTAGQRILECVPNFSEGCDPKVIEAIASAISSVEGVKVLHVDPGAAANRTVVTFAGEPDAVVEAAFRGVRKAAELIDMRRQKGEHPRIGATDVLPLVPVRGITLDEATGYAVRLAKRIFGELGIPTYLYEAAASRPERRKLEYNRRGEWEGLREKISTEEGRPDFGPTRWTPEAERAGATIVGARDYLIAVNFNLDTVSARIAGEIAGDIRESGRVAGEAGDGKQRLPGSLKGVKAIGWYIAEYGFAQVSVNITDIPSSPLNKVFDEVREKAAGRGVNVTGTEIIGLVPESVLVDAGRYFAAQGGVPGDLSDEELISGAIDAMGLSQIKPFDPREKVIEYLLR